jgi:hypothetical protein
VLDVVYGTVSNYSFSLLLFFLYSTIKMLGLVTPTGKFFHAFLLLPQSESSGWGDFFILLHKEKNKFT